MRMNQRGAQAACHSNGEPAGLGYRVPCLAWLDRIGYNGTREPTLGTLHKLISAHSHAIAYEPLDIMLGRFEAAIVGAYYGRLAGGAAPQYTQAGRQIMPSDEGLVKAMLTSLLRSDLDFMKSANLAGHMTTNLWKETQRNTTKPENVAQIAISILMSASACPYRSGSEADRYLWGHQRATSKARLWFSSIDHTEQAKLAASLWYRQKAQELSRLQGEETFYRRLVGPSDRLEEDL